MRPEVPRTLAEKVDPQHAALIVVDIQNDFCATDGLLAQYGSDMTLTQEMVPRLERFIDEARKVELPIIYVQVTHNEQNTSAAWLDQRLMHTRKNNCTVEGTWGAEFYRLQPLPGEMIIQKHRYSAFVGTELDPILRSMGIGTVVVTGVGTNVCVESTARDAFQRDYYVVMLEDCVATTSLEAHLASLNNIRRHFGLVVTSGDVIAAWEAEGVYARVERPQ